jgi:hypothetical protein
MTPNEIRRLENLPALPDGDSLALDPARTLSASMAMRDLLVDALRRQTGKLCDRLSRLVTPERVTDFAERWCGDLGRESFVDSIRPAVRAWLSSLGRESDTDAICEALSRDHFSTTSRRLSAMTKAHSGEQFERALTQQIAAWRTCRDVERVVDHLVAHGVTPPADSAKE